MLLQRISGKPICCVQSGFNNFLSVDSHSCHDVAHRGLSNYNTHLGDKLLFVNPNYESLASRIILLLMGFFMQFSFNA